MEVGVDQKVSAVCGTETRTIEGDICNRNTEDINECITTSSQSAGSSLDVSEVHKVAENVGAPNPEAKLCGWLHLRAKGIGNLKPSRLRWFVLGEENCKLYYYRDPQDLLPLGEICIENASFYFDASNIDKPGMFQIKSDGKETLLDAGNRHSMMYWLQSLQAKRREYNLARVSVSTDRVGQWSLQRSSHVSSHVGGLLSKEKEPSGSSKFNPEDLSSFPEIHISVGETTNSNTTLNSSSKTSATWALNNLKSEIQNVLSSIKLPGKVPKEQEGCVFYDDELKPHSGSNVEPIGATDHMSDSSASINSVSDGRTASDNNALNMQTATDKQTQMAGEGKGRTGSQILSSSAEKSLSQSVGKNKSVELRPRSHSKNKPYPQSMNSWTMVDTATELQEGKPVDNAKSITEKSKDSTDTVGKDSFNMAKTLDGNAMKTGKFMSTFRKIRLGKRQISEPGAPLQKSVSDSSLICPRCKMPVVNNSVTGSQPNSQSPLTTSGSSKDIQDLQEELQANREIVALLQKRLDGLVRELDSRQQAGEIDDSGKTAMLVERDKQIAGLSHTLNQTKQDYSIIAEKLRSTEAELKTSREHCKMYEDMFKAKDEIIMRLTNQIFDYDQAQQESDDRDQTSTVTTKNLHDSTTLKSDKLLLQVDDRELEKLKDMCQGYELQHKFLAKEILELNELRKFDQAREKHLIIDSAKLQAKYYQIKSKYFVLLKVQKQRGNPVRDGEEEQEVINQLLQDALEADSDDIELHLTGSSQEYDRYGFSWRHYMVEEPQDVDPLSDKAAELERQSAELSTKVKEADQDASLRVKWDNYMVGRGGKVQRNQELKTLIRHGVPHEYREEVWKGCIQLYIGTIREKFGSHYYSDLLQRKNEATMSNPADKQIELDLLRTLPNNKHYDSIDSDGVTKLRRILLAFSEYNKVIGYCQGLNRLAAISLLFLNEEDAFWCLVAIVDHILPQHYFSTTLMAAQADQRVLKDLVLDKLPKVHQVLEANNVDLSLFTFNWFLTIFVDNIPTEMFLRIWDTLLYEGSKVLFRFAIAFLKKTEGEILEQTDGLQLNRYLRRIGEKMTNVKQISWIAFNWINPFPMRFIATRRQQHIHDIQLELQELDKLRHGMKMTREEQEKVEYETEAATCDDDHKIVQDQTKVPDEKERIVQDQTKVPDEKERIVQDQTKVPDEIERIVQDQTKVADEIERIQDHSKVSGDNEQLSNNDEHGNAMNDEQEKVASDILVEIKCPSEDNLDT